MDKGDIKLRKGKIARGLYAITRSRVVTKSAVPKVEAPKPAAPQV